MDVGINLNILAPRSLFSSFPFLSRFPFFCLSPVFCFLSPIVSLRGSHPIEVQIMIVGRPTLLPEILFYLSIRPIEETAGSTK